MRLPRKIKKRCKQANATLALLKAMGRLPNFGAYEVVIDPDQDIIKQGKIKIKIIPPAYPEWVTIK